MNSTQQNNNNLLQRTGMTALKAALFATLASLSAGVLAAQDTALQSGQEYMVVNNYPNNLHVIELSSDTILKTCELPTDFGPGTIRVAPDNKTAYVLTNHYEDVYGVDLDSCMVVFTAKQSSDNERVKSIFSIALSPDGKELYTMQNPTQLNQDHYRVQDTRLAVFNTADGLNAKPVRTFPAPRQVTVMTAADDGKLLMLGADFYSMDVQTGDYEVVLKDRNWERPLYAGADTLYAWPQDNYSNEFFSLYTTARFKDDKMDLNTADWIYGYHSIDLKTGKAESVDFGPIVEIYFTGMRNPADSNQVFGVLNRLAKYDVSKKELIKVAELDHSYYVISMNEKGSKVYLTGTFNDVAIFDAETLERTGNIELPGGDMALTTGQIFKR